MDFEISTNNLQVLGNGLVFLRGALNEESQIWLANYALEAGMYFYLFSSFFFLINYVSFMYLFSHYLCIFFLIMYLLCIFFSFYVSFFLIMYFFFL